MLDTMSKNSPAAAPETSLSIGDLAEQTGVTPATLRAWEQRYGYPRPARGSGGHRRYDAHAVTQVRDILARRDRGVRLDIAITEALASSAPEAPSVFATIRKEHPHVPIHRLRKSTLLALSWAIEDEFCAKAERPYLFGTFQERRFFEPAQKRWRALTSLARGAFAYADFADPAADPEDDPLAGLDGPEQGGPALVHLAPDAPLRREWIVACDAVGLPAVLTAWELPGQDDVPDADRLFESAWSVEPAVVRSAARTCAQIAADLDTPGAAPALYHLAETPLAAAADLGEVSRLMGRVVAYVDRYGHRHGRRSSLIG